MSLFYQMSFPFQKVDNIHIIDFSSKDMTGVFNHT